MVLTLFNLENSRAFRVHWLALELGVSIESRNYARIEGKRADPQMAQDSGYTLGKSPCLVDQDNGTTLRVVESANCMLYLVERYAPQSALLPAPPHFEARTTILGWMDFAETIMTHALAIVYAQWFAPTPDDENEQQTAKTVTETIETKAQVNVGKDLDQIETTLQGHFDQAKDDKNTFIVGEELTAADIALCFSVEYVLCKELAGPREATTGTGGPRWPRIEAWIRQLEQRPAYQKVLAEGPRYDLCLLKQTA